MCRRRSRSKEASRTTSVPVFNSYYFGNWLALWTFNSVFLTMIIFHLQLFVYLFAPIVHHLKESDFQNYRLENGIKLWHGMWEYTAPGAPCFTAAVKPKARQLLNSLMSPRGSLDAYCREYFDQQWISSPHLTHPFCRSIFSIAEKRCDVWTIKATWRRDCLGVVTKRIQFSRNHSRRSVECGRGTCRYFSFAVIIV